MARLQSAMAHFFGFPGLRWTPSDCPVSALQGEHAKKADDSDSDMDEDDSESEDEEEKARLHTVKVRSAAYCAFWTYG